MNWKYKALLQRIASRIPLGIDLYFIGQRLVGNLKVFRIDNRLKSALNLIDCLTENNESLIGKCAIEIGTGWAPVIPVFFWLYGLSKCDTYDILHLLRPSFVIQTIDQIDDICSKNLPIIANWKNRDIDLENERLPVLKKMITNRSSPELILDQCNIKYHSPADVSMTGFPNMSFDLVFSNLVLGEIPLSGLEAIFSEAFRILRKGGLMLHVIDLSDQFKDTRQKVSSINFLQFSTQEFSKYISKLNYQNRLRSSEYRTLIEKHGFKIISWNIHVDQMAMLQLPKIKVNPDFAVYSPEILCTTRILFLAKRY